MLTMADRVYWIIAGILLSGLMYRTCRALSIQLENGVPSPTIISAIANQGLALHCEEFNLNKRIVWRKEGDATLEIFNANLTFTSIQLSHGGVYKCIDDVNGATQSVEIKILYHPSLPTITGPDVVIKGFEFTLECSADSQPPPTFYWTASADPNSQVVARGSEYADTISADVYEDIVFFYCWAENTMFPTTGSSVTSRQHQKFSVTPVEDAYIWELHNSYTFNVSTNLVIECKVTGSPHPNVWWTRDNHSDFMFTGETLFIRDVQMDVAGYYTCHAQNSFKPSNKREHNNTDIKRTVITINDPEIPEECKGSCQRLVNEALDGFSCKSDTSDNACDNDCKRAYTIVAAVGWIVVIVLITIILVNCWNHRRNRSTGLCGNAMVKMEPLHDETNRPGLTSEERLTSRPVVPVRPDVTRNEDHHRGVSEVLRDEDERRGSKVSGKYSYIEPVSSELPHDYLQLNSKIPTRTIFENTVNSGGITNSSVLTPQLYDNHSTLVDEIKPCPVNDPEDGYLTFVKYDHNDGRHITST